jgi:hypothetical protein
MVGGDFRVVVEAFGNHGCERDKKDGESVLGCDRHGCVDCITREYVRRLKRTGAHLRVAKIVHIGYTPEQDVTDDLLTGVRAGAF